MSLVAMNWSPTNRQLRQFGLALAVVLPLVGWSWNLASAALACLAVLGMFCAGVAYFWPGLLKPAYLGLALVTLPMGLLAAEVALLASFFLVFAPCGILGRLLGRTIISRGFDSSATSYWQVKTQPEDRARYLRQF